MTSRVLVLGAGGREHALAWKLSASPHVAQVYVAPGNPGVDGEPKCRSIGIPADDVAGLLSFVLENGIDFTVVGPEAPLSVGVVDAFRAAGKRIFGPTRSAAQLESSKAFAKNFLERHSIPTAAYGVFESLEPALQFLRSKGAPIVVKADGLAAGKGVVVALTLDEAESAARDMLAGGTMGAAGCRVVIEEFLDGEEASFIVVANGTQYVPLATSQDHKRVFDGDQGPNTGGMGAYSPAPVVTPEVHARICREVIEPTLAGMVEEGNPFCGFLYAGLMIDRAGKVKVLEFNTRMGDPETQPILFRMESDLLELLEAAVDGRLETVSVQWSSEPALGVVMAAHGYPGPLRKGDVIRGLTEDLGNAKVFHAGTARHGSDIVTNGGRVLCVVGRGHDVAAAQRSVYRAVDKITWDGVQYRTDIGYRAIARESAG